MPGLFDLILGLGGRPDPRQQILANLGQAPGQPGSSTGPVPGAPPVAPPSAPPAGPTPGPVGAAPGPAAPAAAGPAGPPQPQSLQSPPDLAAANAKLANPSPANAPAPEAAPVAGDTNLPPRPEAPGPMPGSHIQLTPEMMLQMYNRDRAEQGFYRGLALMGAGMYPGRNPQANAMMIPQSQDPGSLMSQIAGLQKYQAEQETRQALWNRLPQIAKDNDLTLDQAKEIFLTDPEGLTKLTLQQAGYGTGPLAQQKFDVRNWQKQHPDEPIPPYMSGNIASYGATAKDVATEQNSFDTRKSVLVRVQNLASELRSDPALKSALSKWSGMSQQDQSSWMAYFGAHGPAAIGALSAEESTAIGKLMQLNSLKTEAATELGGGGRRAAAVTKSIAGGLTRTGNLAAGWEPMQGALDDVLDYTRHGIADLHGAAGFLSTMEPEYEKYLSPEYGPKGPNYRGGLLPSQRGEKVPEEAAPATKGPVQVTSPADVAKLPSGTPFIVPSGPHKGETRYAP